MTYECASHSLLVRAGYIRQHAAGIYNYLNLGLRSLRRIENTIRAEMEGIGAQEVALSFVHDADVWKQTGRYQLYEKLKAVHTDVLLDDRDVRAGEQLASADASMRFRPIAS